MTSTKGAAKKGVGIALESYLAAIRLTQDEATLGELEDQLESDERLRTADRMFLRTLVESRVHAA